MQMLNVAHNPIFAEHGLPYFKSMDKVYGIKPGADQYACMIDLLGRSGKMHEAKELLNEMVVEPDLDRDEQQSAHFMSEDRSHPRTNEIYSKVDEVLILIKEAGYFPDRNFALHDINEEGKELRLAYHSEKLAVAFGLLVVPQAAPIHIYKNLCVCGD
ncbi:unnamed protein product [Ilex paraguariensis]|uniref:DYW domain-containing protein n=1 Tax=Ilex paraguariensis TaxID=185542 RepID=A0ABC8RUT5_9AQUA